MKLSAIVAVASMLSAMAVAIPLEKRKVIMITKTDVVYTTVDVVKTIWVDGSSGSTSAPKVAPQPSAAPVPAPAPAPQPKSHKAPKPSIQAVPTPSPVPAPSPAPSPVAPKPKKPKHHKQPAPAPASSSAPASPSSSPGSGGVGPIFTGDMTHYAVGLGSCGWTSTPNENVVALSWQTMNNPANPNLNPLCGKMISISYGGTTQTAKIVDTCQACVPGDLDMSDGLFAKFAPLGLGRIGGIKWSYIS